MKPGRELDALVAEKVMKSFIPAGSNPLLRDDAWIDINCDLTWDPPPYSHSIEAAFAVVQKVEKEHYPFILTVDRYSGVYSGGRWLASFCVPMDVYECGPLGDDAEAMGYWYNPGLICAGETPAQAICLAALRACSIDIPHES